MELNKKTIKKILLIVFLSALIVCAVFKFDVIIAFIPKIVAVLNPIIIGLCVAFVLNVLLKALETKVFSFMGKSKHKFVTKLRRPICLVLTYILALGIIALLVLVIIPDLVDTIVYLVKELPSYLSSLRESIVSFAGKFGIAENKIPMININPESTLNALQGFMSDYSNKIVNGAANITSSVVGGVYDTIFSIIISVYVLAQKERIAGFFKRVIDTFIPKNATEKIYHFLHLAYESFTHFIGGQLVESVILGLLCYLGMTIFRFPNAPIISVLIGMTSLIPIVGSIIGVAVGAFLIVITNPIKALLFVLFIIILQQLEGNLIYPKVVGKAVGLPAIIVVCAVLIGGNLGGIVGVLLSVPLAALGYTLLNEAIEKKNKKIEQ